MCNESMDNTVKIKMVGVDYSRANVEQRGAFAFSHSRYCEVSARIKEKYNVDGLVIISTCNRTEFWFSCESDVDVSEVFCYAMDVSEDEKESLLLERAELDAVKYLFELVCGIHSQIFGDDQILTQIKTALNLARKNKDTDNVLEILFRTAVTAGKKVKTKTRLTEDNSSVAEKAINSIEAEFGNLDGKKCLVIGNGQTGRLACKYLVEKGLDTYMTLRQYKRHDAVIPRGVTVVDYEKRYDIMEDMDIIVSATLSPNFTVTANELEGKIRNDRNYVFVDLAVPRDIETVIADKQNVTLYDVDAFAKKGENIDKIQLNMAEEILEEYIDEFEKWYHFREYIPSVQKIGEIASNEAKGKTKKALKVLEIEPDQKQNLSDEIGLATQKIVQSLMYGLRDHLDREVWLECMSALEHSAKDMEDM